MKKNIIYKILMFIDMIALMFSTVLAVYTTKLLIKEIEFRFDLLIGVIGSYALIVGLFILFIFIVLKVLGVNNGKNR